MDTSVASDEGSELGCNVVEELEDEAMDDNGFDHRIRDDGVLGFGMIWIDDGRLPADLRWHDGANSFRLLGHRVPTFLLLLLLLLLGLSDGVLGSRDVQVVLVCVDVGIEFRDAVLGDRRGHQELGFVVMMMAVDAGPSERRYVGLLEELRQGGGLVAEAVVVDII